MVESTGFNNTGWTTVGIPDGCPACHRAIPAPDFGHIDLELTIDDSKAYTKPWSVTLHLTLVPDTDLIEYVCDENEKDLKHLVGKYQWWVSDQQLGG